MEVDSSLVKDVLNTVSEQIRLEPVVSRLERAVVTN